MKKILTVALAVVMLGVGASAALAAGQGCGRGLSGVHHNGLCNQLHANCAYTDANGDGVCDNCGTGLGHCANGANFVDANGDGVCDSCGTGLGHCANGVNYVDANGDGVCDNCGTGAQMQNGHHDGQGYHGGRHQ